MEFVNNEKSKEIIICEGFNDTFLGIMPVEDDRVLEFINYAFGKLRTFPWISCSLIPFHIVPFNI